MKRRVVRPGIVTLFAVGLLAGSISSTAAEEKVTVETLAEFDAGTGGIEVDANGNVYSSDFGAILGNPATAGTRIWKIGTDGKAVVFEEGFEGAPGNAIDSKGNFYQSNIRGGYVSKITPDGEVGKFATDGLRAPVGIVIDGSDTLFVANCGGNSIQRIGSDGASTRFAEGPLFQCPNGITLDESHNLYVANFYNGNVIKITPEGEASKLATLPGGNNGHLVYVAGALFVVDRAGHRIYKVSLSGESSVFAGSGKKGGKDGSALEASFCYPNDIAASADGKTLYVNEVADESSKGSKLAPTRVRRIRITAVRSAQP